MRKNIFHLLNKATKDLNLKHSDVRILNCLISYNSFNKIFPSQETISNDIGIKSRPDISKGLRNLERNGYIEIKRRKHQSNLYKLNTEDKIKPKLEKPKIEKESKDENIKYMDKAMIEIVAGEVAKAKGKNKHDSSDFSFVNSMLKIKEGDKYKEDSYNVIRKCLILLYFINIHFEKFENGNNFYPYIKKIYSLADYSDIKSKIFNSNVAVQSNEYEVLN